MMWKTFIPQKGDELSLAMRFIIKEGAISDACKITRSTLFIYQPLMFWWVIHDTFQWSHKSDHCALIKKNMLTFTIPVGYWICNNVRISVIWPSAYLNPYHINHDSFFLAITCNRISNQSSDHICSGQLNENGPVNYITVIILGMDSTNEQLCKDFSHWSVMGQIQFHQRLKLSSNNWLVLVYPKAMKQ